MSINAATEILQGRYNSENNNYDLGNGNIVDLSDGTIDQADLDAIVAAYADDPNLSGIFDVDTIEGVNMLDANIILEDMLASAATDTNAPVETAAPADTAAPAETATTPELVVDTPSTVGTVVLPGQARGTGSTGQASDGLIATSSGSDPTQIYTEGYHYEQGMSGMMCGMQTTVIDVQGDSVLDRDSNAVIDDLNGDGVQGGDEDIVIANAFVRGLAALETSGDGMLTTAECQAKDTDSNGIITGTELGIEDYEYQFSYSEDTAGALTITMESQDGVQSFVSLKECTQGTDGQIDLNSMGLAAATAMVNTAYTDYVEKMALLRTLILALIQTMADMAEEDEVDVEVGEDSITINGVSTPATSETIASLGITSGTYTVGELRTTLETAENGISTAPAATVIEESSTTDTADTTDTVDTTDTTDTTDTSTSTSPSTISNSASTITSAISRNVSRSMR